MLLGGPECLGDVLTLQVLTELKHLNDEKLFAGNKLDSLSTLLSVFTKLPL